MRAIKFRAWDKKRKKMLDITPYNWKAGKNINNEIQFGFINEFDISKEGYADRETGKSVFLTFDGDIVGILPLDRRTTESIKLTDEYILMQYTGLKDKNGKEIYEGDIVKRHKNEVFNIEFERGQFGVYIGIEGFIPGWRSLDKFVTDFKVIGNIYENPELLGNK